MVNTSFSWIYSLQDGTSVWIREADENVKKLDLPINSLFIFKGYLIHAGDRYLSQNFRLHGHVDAIDADGNKKHRAENGIYWYHD